MKTHRILSILAALTLAALVVTLPLLAQDGEDEGKRGHGPRGWEGFAEQHDVNGDGQVTREELVQTLDLFDHLDSDGDGALSEADFDARHTAMAFGFTARRADDNGDDQVTAAEWDAWFAERDANGDGVLSADDRPERGERARSRDGAREGRRGHRGHHGPHGGFHGEKLAEARDADGDGDVTRADFAALSARFDANGDGMLTEDEVPALGREGREGRGWRGHHRRGFHGGR
jgi:Ca2+-binding EF-hand superfamily protein